MDIALDDAYITAPLSEVVARANRAASICERAAGVLAEQGEQRMEALVAYKRAREAAAMAGRLNRAVVNNRAERYRNGLLAARFCEAAEAEAGRFAHLDIDPDAVWTEPGAEVAEVKVAETTVAREVAEAANCEADPAKRASMGRYKKGCRCAACKRAATAYQAARRARK
jgi:hypothetical protein